MSSAQRRPSSMENSFLKRTPPGEAASRVEIVVTRSNRKTMKRLLPLCVALLALNGWAQTLQSNVRIALVRLELDTKVEMVPVGHHVYLRPLGGKDAIRQWIETHHTQVKRQLPLLSR